VGRKSLEEKTERRTKTKRDNTSIEIPTRAMAQVCEEGEKAGELDIPAERRVSTITRWGWKKKSKDSYYTEGSVLMAKGKGRIAKGRTG